MKELEANATAAGLPLPVAAPANKRYFFSFANYENAVQISNVTL